MSKEGPPNGLMEKIRHVDKLFNGIFYFLHQRKLSQDFEKGLFVEYENLDKPLANGQISLEDALNRKEAIIRKIIEKSIELGVFEGEILDEKLMGYADIFESEMGLLEDEVRRDQAKGIDPRITLARRVLRKDTKL
ncbi:hypothetical protein HZA26_01260 [Candidatus Nomurabacteria bacterium]|nr:hypothetical protein [Candidatus Nomurabacteria bacterium]